MASEMEPQPPRTMPSPTKVVSCPGSASSTTHNPSERARDALRILDEAADLARSWFDRGQTEIETKRDGSPVTLADRDVEQFLRHSLEDRFPDDGVLGEEFPEKKTASGNRWILDPIDGTKSFIRGVPLYATLLAYQQQDDIIFGAIALPSLSQTIYAERGGGCWANGQQARVSRLGDLSGAHVMATWLEDWDVRVLEKLQRRGAIVRTWGDAYGYFLVATGRADAIVDYTVQLYDVAPMSVIVEEAGGRFTSTSGVNSLHTGSGLATNGLIHEPLLDTLGSETANA